MKLLFIQGGTRLKEDTDGNLYTDGNLNNKVWERYKSYCDELLILLRKEEKKYSNSEANEKFNKLNIDDKVKVKPLIDLMKPKKRFFIFKYRKLVKKEIERNIK